jgi:hypothetical protein
MADKVEECKEAAIDVFNFKYGIILQVGATTVPSAVIKCQFGYWSYHVISCHIMSFHVVQVIHVFSCNSMSFHVIS